MKLSPLYTGAG